MDKGDLEKKSLADLRYIAKMMDIKSPTKYKKEELIDLIVNIETSASEVGSEKAVPETAPVPPKKTAKSKKIVKTDNKNSKGQAIEESADKTSEPIVTDKIPEEPVADKTSAELVAERNAEEKPKRKNSKKTEKKIEESAVESAEEITEKTEESEPVEVLTIPEVKEVKEKNTKTSARKTSEKKVAEPKTEKRGKKRSTKKEESISDVPAEDITVSEIPTAEVTETVEEVIEKTETIAEDEEVIAASDVTVTEEAPSEEIAETPNAPAKEQRSQNDNGKDVDGILELMQEGYGFLRVENFVSSSKDIYVPPTLIRKYGLKTGDLICGKCRFQKDSDRSQALMWISTVNGYALNEHPRRRPFETLTPIYPEEKFVLEVDKKELSTRLIDLIAPIGKGQRGMIVSPPKAGKTVLLKKIANSITSNYPDVELFVLLIDERPEEVTDMKESVNGTVVSSTFDELPERHIKVSELVLERAQRLVEYGKDVVILMDSITRLARAYNLTIPPTGRSLSGGLDPGALHKPKKFFGAARNIRGGGSLTIVATALVDTGSKLDDVIFEEFKGTGNMELHLDRKLSEKRIFPAIDINKSGTRREDLLLTEKELNTIFNIRRAMSNLGTADVTEILVNQLTKTENNEEFIASVKFSEKDGK